MKINLKTFVTTGALFFSLALLPMSCGVFCNDSCGCGASFPEQFFRIRSFELFTSAFDGQRIFPDDSQPWDQYYKGFRVDQFDLISDIPARKSALGVALACDPAPPKSEKKLNAIRIINLKEESIGNGMILEVGQDITDLFGMNFFFSQGLEPIQDFISTGRELYLDQLFKLGFKNDPGRDLTLSLSISFILEDGTEFTFLNEPFTIQTKN